ncbi:MAG: type II toxin-antitoxin system prevent-host-death family antitoxin [Spirochaetaceae bacterium]|nr:type II toxin-antitoxin system prevent-host-death family antitoxin [Spirochaetaceae bacterium]
MCNAVPVFEAKNKLPFFIHLAETDGPVPISRHNQEVAYIVSKADYEEMMIASKPQKSIVEKMQERRKKYGLEDDDFDYTEYFDSLRERAYFGRSGSEHIFDDVEI